MPGTSAPPVWIRRPAERVALFSGRSNCSVTFAFLPMLVSPLLGFVSRSVGPIESVENPVVNVCACPDR